MAPHHWHHRGGWIGDARGPSTSGSAWNCRNARRLDRPERAAATATTTQGGRPGEADPGPVRRISPRRLGTGARAPRHAGATRSHPGRRPSYWARRAADTIATPKTALVQGATEEGRPRKSPEQARAAGAIP